MTRFADQPTDPLPHPAQSPPRRRSRGTVIIIWLMLLVGVAAALIFGARIASESIVKPIVAGQVEDDLNESVRTIVGNELAASPIEPGQSEQFTVSEAEINRQIDAQPDLGPLDEARAELSPEGIEVHLRAYGLSGVYRARIAVSDGAATIQGGEMSGPLGFVLPDDELERIINQAIAASLNEAGMQVTQATLADGEIVLTLESTGAGHDIPTG